VFSGRTLVGNVSWYAYSNTDFLVAGRMLGANALGSYGFAWQLTSLPVEKVTALVGRVTPAFLSVNRENRAIMQRYILRITEGIALITLPATVGIALVAGDLIPTIFGAKWDMVIAPLRILAACMVLRSIVPVVMHAMRTAGDVRFLMWHGIATASVFPFCFVAGARAAGVQGIAMAWLFAYPVALAPLYWRAIRTGLVDGRGYLIALAPAIEGTVAMAVVVMAARSALIASGWSSHVVLLVLEIVTGIVTYSLYLLVRHRGRVRDAVAFVKNGRSAAAVA
jgi:PST family polysaccharide transporter